MLLPVLAVLAGVALLAVAADQFVVGAARIAVAARVPALVVGVVLVGFGTSLPEALVSSFAAARGEMAVALGNVVGSNLANLSLLLGIGALVSPIAVTSTAVRRELPLTVAAAAALAVVAAGSLSRTEGAFLLAGMAATVAGIVVHDRRMRRRDPLAEEVDEFVGDRPRLAFEVLRTALGLAGTLAGSQALLWGGIRLAEELDLAAGFVGATIVAVGTSLPELVTVVQSARHRQPDLIVGNLLGSNLFNALAVTGLAGVIGDAPVGDRTLTFDATLAALVLTVVAGLFLVTGRMLTRREGFILLVVYAGVVVWVL